MAAAQPSAAKNAVIGAASAVTVGLLFLYPTSTHSGAATRRPGQALAPAGVVAAPSTVSASKAPKVTAIRVNGGSAGTRYGPVQVQITVLNGKITAATAIDYPQTNGRDYEINSYAIPALNDETVSAQSAQIDTISGATYTSDGYRRSLQSAIDAAHLK